MRLSLATRHETAGHREGKRKREAHYSTIDQYDSLPVKGLLHTLRATLPAMIDRGDVVVLGSVAGRQVYPGGNVYCATKFAARALYEALRLDAAGKGISFTTVDPAWSRPSSRSCASAATPSAPRRPTPACTRSRPRTWPTRSSSP